MTYPFNEPGPVPHVKKIVTILCNSSTSSSRLGKINITIDSQARNVNYHSTAHSTLVTPTS